MASIVGLSSVMTGILTEAGMALRRRRGRRDPGRRGRRRDQRVPHHRRRPALARGDDRHARAVPRHRRGAARHHGDHRVPRVLDRPRQGQHPRHADPGHHDPVRRARDRVRGAAALHAVRPLALRDRPQQGGRRVLGHRRRAHEVPALPDERHRRGFAGVYFTLLYSNARGDNATGMELSVIAAVLLGGVSIFGGRGALHGVIAGVLLIGTLVERPAPRRRHAPTSSTSSPGCCSCSRWCRQASSPGSAGSGSRRSGRRRGAARRQADSP